MKESGPKSQVIPPEFLPKEGDLSGQKVGGKEKVYTEEELQEMIKKDKEALNKVLDKDFKKKLNKEILTRVSEKDLKGKILERIAKNEELLKKLEAKK